MRHPTKPSLILSIAVLRNTTAREEKSGPTHPRDRTERLRAARQRLQVARVQLAHGRYQEALVAAQSADRSLGWLTRRRASRILDGAVMGLAQDARTAAVHIHHQLRVLGRTQPGDPHWQRARDQIERHGWGAVALLGRVLMERPASRWVSLRVWRMDLQGWARRLTERLSRCRDLQPDRAVSAKIPSRSVIDDMAVETSILVRQLCQQRPHASALTKTGGGQPPQSSGPRPAPNVIALHSHPAFRSAPHLD